MMAFVNERILEADKDYYNSFHFQNPVTHERDVPWKWTIDRERDIFLVALGGQGACVSEIPAFYVMVWKGKRIGLQTYSKAKGNYQSGEELWWKITGIFAPASLKPIKEELVELVREAIDAHGSANKRDHVTRVNFDLIAEPVFVEEAK